MRARLHREAHERIAGMRTAEGSATSPAQGVVDFLDLLVLPVDGLIHRPLVDDDLGRRVGEHVARLHLGGGRGDRPRPAGGHEPLGGPAESPVVLVLVEIVLGGRPRLVHDRRELTVGVLHDRQRLLGDRKSTRLNSSHVEISYAVFCLKKKKKTYKSSNAKKKKKKNKQKK